MPTGVSERKKRSSTPPAANESEAAPPQAQPKKRRKSGKRGARARTAMIPRGKVGRIVAPPEAGGLPRFGYFSDGSLLLECTSCQGTLTQADLVALRKFTSRFEKAE